MSMKPADRIVAESRGDRKSALVYAGDNGAARLLFLTQYVDTVLALCAQPDTPDAAVVVAQSSEETNVWRSFWWRSRGNPAGIGITGDPEEDTASEVFETGTEAARAHVAHLLLYATGAIDAAGLTPKDDPRYDAYVKAHGRNATAATIAGLAGTWATDPAYAPKICAHGNAIWPSLPNQAPPEGGTDVITKPPIYDLATDYARYGLSKGQADNILAKRIANRLGYQPQGIVWHIQDGRTIGSLEFWSDDSVQASSTVMIQKDGSILNIVPRQHGPWTNGDSNAPSPRGRTLISLGGGDANRVSITAEVEGGPWDAMPAAQQNACVWFALDVMRQYPNIDLNDMYRHADINSVTRPNCPGNYYAPLMQAIADAVSGPPPRPKPTIDWIRGEIGLGEFNDTPVLKLVGAATLLADTTSRYAASTKAKAWKRYTKGQTVVVVGTLDSGWSFIDAGDGAFPRIASMRLSPSYPKPKDVPA